METKEIITITINDTIFNVRLSDLRECELIKVINSSEDIIFEIKIVECETLTIEKDKQ